MDQNLSLQNFSAKIPALPWLEMGSGFLVGMAVGYFLKKSFKFMLLLLGIGLVLIFLLESQHVVIIDENGLVQTVSRGSELFQSFALFLRERLARLSFAGGASGLAGFLVGLKMG